MIRSEYDVFDPQDWDRNTDIPTAPVPEPTPAQKAASVQLFLIFLVTVAIGVAAAGLIVMASRSVTP